MSQASTASKNRRKHHLYNKRQLDRVFIKLLAYLPMSTVEMRPTFYPTCRGGQKGGHINILCSKANDVLLSVSAGRHLFSAIICLESIEFLKLLENVFGNHAQLCFCKSHWLSSFCYLCICGVTFSLIESISPVLSPEAEEQNFLLLFLLAMLRVIIPKLAKLF
uniref:Uncharacterized protein n=1 Tax=Micrurus spixii TaxID=129469 RepID=A0A2D4MDG8_9SAUR